MNDKTKKKPLPEFKSDAEAEKYIDTADLTQCDLSGGHEMRFEFEKKSEQVNMRMPKNLLLALKAKAKIRGIPYQRLIRETLEKSLH